MPVITIRRAPGEDLAHAAERLLRELCAPFGTITNINVTYYRSRAHPVGFAFVDLETQEQVARVIDMLGALPFANGVLFHFLDGETPGQDTDC